MGTGSPGKKNQDLCRVDGLFYCKLKLDTVDRFVFEYSFQSFDRIFKTSHILYKKKKQTYMFLYLKIMFFFFFGFLTESNKL